MKNPSLKALSLAVIAFCHQAVAADIVYFGDSLTDGGSYRPMIKQLGANLGIDANAVGQFTTNPDNTWAAHLSSALGSSTNNNYATGGARAGEIVTANLADMLNISNANPVKPTNTNPANSGLTLQISPISSQIDTYLEKNKVNPNTIYSVWAGANDLLATNKAKKDDEKRDIVLKSAAAVGQSVAKLHQQGAKTILLPNIPDVGLSPLALSQGQPASQTATNGTASYNSLVLNQIKNTGANVVVLDTFGLSQEVAKNPSAYGFSNMTAPACGTAASVVCTPKNWATADANRTHFFADGVHPTGRVHKMIADYAYGVLTAPAQMANISQLAHKNLQQNAHTLDARRTNPELGSHIWAVGQKQTGKVQGLTDNGQSLIVGADFVGDSGTSSIYGQYDDHKYSNNQNRGVNNIRIKSKGLGLSHYHDVGIAHVRTKAGFGGMNINTARQLMLDDIKQQHTAQTKGRYIYAGLDVLYPIRLNTITLKPYVGATINRTVIDEIKEREYGPTAMQFSKQKYTQRLGKVGVQGSFTVNDQLSIGADVAYQKALNNKSYEQLARLATVNHAFTTTHTPNNKGAVLANVSADYKIGDYINTSVFATHQKHDNTQSTAFGVGVSTQF